MGFMKLQELYLMCWAQSLWPVGMRLLCRTVLYALSDAQKTRWLDGMDGMDGSATRLVWCIHKKSEKYNTQKNILQSYIRIQASVVLALEVIWWIISLNRTLSIFYQCFSCFVRSVLMKSITPRFVAKQGLGQRFHCRLHSIAAGASAVALDSTSMMKHPESHSPQIFLKGLRMRMQHGCKITRD